MVSGANFIAIFFNTKTAIFLLFKKYIKFLKIIQNHHTKMSQLQQLHLTQ